MPETIILLPSGIATEYSITAKLKHKIKELEEVVIGSRSQWRRGDTTFFKADSFKIGNERKLADILVKIQGFDITENGLLTFKGKLVEKILLEGEELFADKIKLLLENLPVHKLNTIQALEKQNANKLLKGLIGDDKTFLNLTFKKGNKNILFGDADAGIGTDYRYSFATTLFSLQKKLKIGVINNINSIGEQFDPYQFRPDRLQTFAVDRYRAAINGNTITYLHELANDRYLKNKLFLSNIQSNYKIGKSIAAKTEVTLMSDKLSQNTFYTSRLFGNGGNFQRDEFNKSTYRPRHFLISQSFQIAIDSVTELGIKWELGIDQAKSRFSTEINQNSNVFVSDFNLRNNGRNNFLSLDYNKRISQNKAFKATFIYIGNQLPQNYTILSPDIPGIFSLPDASYQLMDNRFNNESNYFFLNAEKITRHNKVTKSYSLQADLFDYKPHNNIQYKSASEPPLTGDSVYGKQGSYTVSNLRSRFSIAPKIGSRQFTGILQGGISFISVREQGSQRRLIQPALMAGISGKKAYNQRTSDEIEIKYSDEPLRISQLNSVYLPSSFVDFFRNAVIKSSNKLISSSYRLYSTIGSYTYLSNNFSVNKYLTGSSFAPLYKGFIAFRKDSLINKGPLIISLNPEISFPSVFLYAQLNMGVSLNRSTGFLLLNNSINKIRYTTADIYFDLKRNWKKKAYLSNRVQLTSVSNKLLTAGIKSKYRLVNIADNMKFRYFIAKKVDINYSLDIMNYKAFTDDSKFYLFSDISGRYFFSKRKMSVGIKLINITNEKEYYGAGTNNELMFSQFTLPLLKRSVFFTAGFEF